MQNSTGKNQAQPKAPNRLGFISGYVARRLLDRAEKVVADTIIAASRAAADLTEACGRSDRARVVLLEARESAMKQAPEKRDEMLRILDKYEERLAVEIPQMCPNIRPSSLRRGDH
jgi:hypothetical protein